MSINKIIKQFFLDALDSNHPSRLIEHFVSVQDDTISIENAFFGTGNYREIYIIAVGKAARPMAESLKEKLGVPGTNILCISPGNGVEDSFCISSSHPIPDEKSRAAADQLIDFIENMAPESIVFFAISGGTSALICRPAAGIQLQDINATNKMLLESGANIKEINSVRKHISAIKGGQLLRKFKPGCTLVNLIISDVPSDDPGIIGSGLTTPDSSTFRDARDSLKKYNLWDKCPEAVRNYIEKGLNGEVPETLRPEDNPLRQYHSFIIGSARRFAKTVAAHAAEKNFTTWVADEPFNHHVRNVAAEIVHIIEEKREKIEKPAILVFYGESTVEVTGDGKGGRNQELALRGALGVADMDGITWLSAGTDGVDGPTDAAGAIVDNTTVKKAEENELDARSFIERNDSYHFHEQMGTLLKTGPTGNNVMDVVIVGMERRED